MTRPVQWSRDALEDAKDQIAYVMADNPTAARKVADRIRDTAAALGAMATGRPGRVAGIYEKPVVRLPYVIAYAIGTGAGGETISILRVIDTSRNWPMGEWPE